MYLQGNKIKLEKKIIRKNKSKQQGKTEPQPKKKKPEKALVGGGGRSLGGDVF